MKNPSSQSNILNQKRRATCRTGLGVLRHQSIVLGVPRADDSMDAMSSSKQCDAVTARRGVFGGDSDLRITGNVNGETAAFVVTWTSPTGVATLRPISLVGHSEVTMDSGTMAK